MKLFKWNESGHSGCVYTNKHWGRNSTTGRSFEQSILIWYHLFLPGSWWGGKNGMIPDCFSLYLIQICLLHFGILDFFPSSSLWWFPKYWGEIFRLKCTVKLGMHRRYLQITLITTNVLLLAVDWLKKNYLNRYNYYLYSAVYRQGRNFASTWRFCWT